MGVAGGRVRDWDKGVSGGRGVGPVVGIALG
jgi:hypothetical protein